MEYILVSIISAQTIPNLLLIKELRGSYSGMLFISTEEMEGRGNPSKSRSQWIERAAGILEGTTPRVVVREDNWPDIEQKLAGYMNHEIQYLVNLTGGTKVMTLAVYKHFARPGNRIFYVPFPKNQYCELYPDFNSLPISISYRCTLSQYLAIHGLYFSCHLMRTNHQSATEMLFEKVKSNDFNLLSIPEIKYAHELEIPEDKSYYSGGWFEEYLYYWLKNVFKLSENRIARNVQLFRNQDDWEPDNEYDLMFVWKNALYVIECKASAGNQSNARKNIDRFLYKLGAITRDFGLKVNSFVFTLTKFRDKKGMLPEKLKKRKNILGIREIFDQESFYTPEKIIIMIKNS
mgnify:CR=1 FL=1